MGKSVGKLETDADQLLQNAVDTLVTRWGQNKLFADSGNGPIGPDQTDRHKVMKILVKRALAMNLRGSVARGARGTNVTAGTVTN